MVKVTLVNPYRKRTAGCIEVKGDNVEEVKREVAALLKKYPNNPYGSYVNFSDDFLTAYFYYYGSD
jgi:hypothetical protein